MMSTSCHHCGRAVAGESLSRDDEGRLCCRFCRVRTFLEQFARVVRCAGSPTPSLVEAVDRCEDMAILIYRVTRGSRDSH